MSECKYIKAVKKRGCDVITAPGVGNLMKVIIKGKHGRVANHYEKDRMGQIPRYHIENTCQYYLTKYGLISEVS